MIKYIFITFILLTGCTKNDYDLSNPIIIPTNNPNLNNPIGEFYTPIENNNDYSVLNGIKVDYDLVTISDTLATATLSSLMYEPHTYRNKKIKILGTYYYEISPDQTQEFNGILRVDNTYCCVGYLEIRLPKDIKYPIVGSEMMLIGEYIEIDNNGQSRFILNVTDYVF